MKKQNKKGSRTGPHKSSAKPATPARAKRQKAKTRSAVRKPRNKAPAALRPIALLPAITASASLRHRMHRKLLLVAGGALAVIVLSWAIGNIFVGTFAIGRQTARADISDAALGKLVAAQAGSYHLSIADPNGQLQTYALREMGLQPDIATTIRISRAAQRSPLHLIAWWRPVHVMLAVQTDNEKLASFIQQHARITITPAQDARLSVDAGKATVTPEKTGKQYGFANAAGSLINAVSAFRSEPLRMTAVALAPQTTASSLNGAKHQLETILGQNLTVRIGDQIVNPSRSDIGGWLIITPGRSGAAITVNRQAVQAYVQAAANEHTTAPRSQVVSDTTGKVLVAGSKGVRVGNTAEAAEALFRAAQNAKGGAVSLPVSFTAFKTVSAPTAGKWIEVDTTTKRMYAYDQGTLVRTFLVSAGAAATPTVTGRFAIYAKYRTQNMSGENADGSNYFQPNVPYVNYFYRDYAIHGNYWRPANYFGNVNSSHGCVGIPVADGAWMYTWAPIGTPVIVHT